MKLSQTLLPQFDQEMATTRKLLERVPDDRIGWKPHEKSMSLGRLATHLAELAGFGSRIMEQDSLDVSSRVGSGYQPKVLESSREMVELFDENVRNSRAEIEKAEDQDLLKHWSLRNGEQVIFNLPRVAVLQTMLISHSIHHRGQLSVYLRLNDVPLPSIYGPTADEGI
ncbi:MAG TPA: DinB family protein [Thermoanaerobaculia bacterium]|nr:DinB family protein [Thermoanaerobaculia bacterium]